MDSRMIDQNTDQNTDQKEDLETGYDVISQDVVSAQLAVVSAQLAAASQPSFANRWIKPNVFGFLANLGMNWGVPKIPAVGSFVMNSPELVHDTLSVAGGVVIQRTLKPSSDYTENLHPIMRGIVALGISTVTAYAYEQVKQLSGYVPSEDAELAIKSALPILADNFSRQVAERACVVMKESEKLHSLAQSFCGLFKRKPKENDVEKSMPLMPSPPRN